LNPDFALGVRTETKEAETVSTKKVKAMVVPWTNFLKKKMSGLLRRIPRPNAKSGLNLVFFRFVIPAEAGIQKIFLFLRQKFHKLDTGVRRYDETESLF